MLRWYDDHARDLPWRRPGVSAWEVMVSEFMLQQTPVARVLEPWRQWIDRWPTPAALAAAPAGEAVRAWGRLGYPRRALRLHRAAEAITEQHAGEVPTELADLLALPGVGSYTAAAIASFAYGQRHVVLDTNVRRVLARVAAGEGAPPLAATAAETRLADRLPAGRPGSRGPLGGGVDGARAPWSARLVRRPASAAPSRTGAPGVGPVGRSAVGPRRRSDVRGHRSSVPGRAAGRAAVERRRGRAGRAGPGLAGRRPARACPDLAASSTAWWSATTTTGTPCPAEGNPTTSRDGHR